MDQKKNEIDICMECGHFKELKGVDRYKCDLTGKIISWYKIACSSAVKPLPKTK